jgi:hypothetical protein
MNHDTFSIGSLNARIQNLSQNQKCSWVFRFKPRVAPIAPNDPVFTLQAGRTPHLLPIDTDQQVDSIFAGTRVG